MASVAALWLALAIDRWLGEPPARWHPVVWMGGYLGWIGDRVAPPDRARHPFASFCWGAVAWCVGASLVGAIAGGFGLMAETLPAWAAALWIGFALKPLLAWRMLRDEVLAVEAALGRSLDEGRTQLGRLVSRDVSALSAVEVRESAIESLAENLNDSMVAPLFWFALLGLPGAAIYRFANTADAMWGYRNARWEWAGKWAARVDDVLSWVPARITAALLAAGSSLQFASCRHEAHRTPSPNGGWPMGTMALLLGVRLAKPGVYVLNEQGREAVASDTARAIACASRVVVLSAIGATLVVLARAGWA
ncbi:adenosylcobinamide-phosphate synthase CbiB [Variovorax sp. Sphag1AA]|uniref:adenosylcobinamide-phosphate synthase CbiB n=1 Tax=Variovorax sp. Sphag1AA TaxID=2587027 RepID=UPI00160B71F0|nr:adenosylcobinamide-phosphate synthase CbiB [Variovorax sp. Sphag1AA]MBB3176092.1 adenosylcobinamide-phosphate synthase [Variovorax sp. Sphag1AA]